MTTRVDANDGYGDGYGGRGSGKGTGWGDDPGYGPGDGGGAMGDGTGDGEDTIRYQGVNISSEPVTHLYLDVDAEVP